MSGHQEVVVDACNNFMRLNQRTSGLVARTAPSPDFMEALSHPK